MHIRNKDEKGVTLIALAITSIVLLILAGISLSTIYGDNGLISTAQEINKNTELAQKEAQEIINAQKEATENVDDEVIIRQDKDAPTINSFDTEIIGEDAIKLSINVTERESGIDTIQYSSDGGENYTIDPTDDQAKSYTFKNVKNTVKYNK